MVLSTNGHEDAPRNATRCSKSSDGRTQLRVRDSVAIAMLAPDEIFGTFYSFSGPGISDEHFAVKLGTVPAGGFPLVRIHSECITGDVFGSARCDCGPQLRESIQRINEQGGFLLYLRQEGRGIGLFAKLAAYRLQDTGLDTFEANRRLDLPEDLRDFNIAAHMLHALGQTDVRLLTNNPDKIRALRQRGIRVRERVATGVYLTRHNRRYIEAKVQKANHELDIETEGAKS